MGFPESLAATRPKHQSIRRRQTQSCDLSRRRLHRSDPATPSSPFNSRHNPVATITRDSASFPTDKRNRSVPTSEQRYKCPVDGCPNTYARRSSVSRHMNIHKGKLYPCSYDCGTIFTRVDNRNTHEVRFHQDTMV